MKSHEEVHDTIYKVITDTEEITWKSIIMDLIKSEDLDPWDINISVLTKRFIAAVKQMKEANLRVSGKVIIAAALLLRIKSSRLIGEDLMEFDRLLASNEDPDLYGDDSFIDGELGQLGIQLSSPGNLPLVPRTPQPRKRKVSVYDLIDALDVALHVKKRRVLNQLRTKEIKIPQKMDITKLMDDLLKDVMESLSDKTEGKVAFSQIVPSDSKHDKVLTFIPLLHLTNARRVDLEQKKHFDEIWVSLAKKGLALQEEPVEEEPQKADKAAESL